MQLWVFVTVRSGCDVISSSITGSVSVVVWAWPSLFSSTLQVQKTEDRTADLQVGGRPLYPLSHIKSSRLEERYIDIDHSYILRLYVLSVKSGKNLGPH